MLAAWFGEHGVSLATFVLGCIVGYGRATARLATMETQIAALQTSVTRLENLMLGKP